MSASPTPPQRTLEQVLAEHAQHCGVPLRGLPATEIDGEICYAVRCPKCVQVVAYIILAPSRGRP